MPITTSTIDEFNGMEVKVAAKSSRSATLGVARKGVHSVGHALDVVPLAGGALAVMSQYEHTQEMHRIAREYSPEISALTGKHPDKVTSKDVERVAKFNPIMQQAVDRSKKRRNLSIAVTAVVAVATLAFMPHIAIGVAAHALATGAIGTAVPILAAGAAGALAFLGLEHGLTKVGEKALKIGDPKIAEVEKGKANFSELSTSKQITYLEHEQVHRRAINRDQVMTVFASANKALDQQIKAQWGKSYDKLDEGRRMAVIKQYNGQLALDGWARDLSSHKVRAQELAFAAYGQASSPDEAFNAGNRIAFSRARVSMAVSGNLQKQEQAQSTAWAEYENNRRRMRDQQIEASLA